MGDWTELPKELSFPKDTVTAVILGIMQDGGLPHAGITDAEIKRVPFGYELWLSCASRGIAVLKVRTLLTSN